MARARPLNECVSRYTRALTLFHLPSVTAFTIRAWSRRTVRQTFLQSMECQSGVRSGAAPAGISAAISTSPGLTCPGLLAPDRRDAGSRRVGLRVHGRSEDRGYVVPQASDVSVAGDARWGSRPMA